MLRRLGALRGWTIQASDGEIGKVDDFYFDDEKWVVRYLVADTGSWLQGRRVLVTPIAFERPDWDGERFRVSITRKQINDSPSVDTRQPVSRQYEAAYLDYYHYPYYWGGSGLWGTEPYPWNLAGMPVTGQVERPRFVPGHNHLRSMSEVNGYHVRALDGEIGHVDDFLFDADTWAIRYLLVDTSNFIGGRHVLIATDWVRRVDWNELSVHVDAEKETIKESPEYDPDRSPDSEYEERLYRHYGRAGRTERTGRD